MDEPLIVPGHSVDNPPTDDFWPHLSSEMHPVLYPDDGAAIGPIPTLGAKWSARSTGAVGFGALPVIADAELALTDSRVILSGRPGVHSPPDRRLVTQFRHVWCSALEWDLGGRGSPAEISLHGLSQGEELIERKLTFRLPTDLDTRALVQDLLRRIARQYLRLDLVDPDAAITRDESEMDYVRELSETEIDPAERQATVPFPRFRWIRHGDDYRLGGPDIRTRMIHAQFASN